jgi:hypothetical protein
MFELEREMGVTPEDLKGASPEQREEYAKWLKLQKSPSDFSNG